MRNFFSIKNSNTKTTSIYNNEILIFIAIVTGLLSDSLSVNAGVIIDRKPQLKNYVEEAPVIISKPKLLAELSARASAHPIKLDSMSTIARYRPILERFQ